MAQSIDTRIVELKFNNDNFADKVDSTLSKLQDLDKSIKTVGLKDSLKNLGKDAKKVDVSGITKGVEEASKGFSKLEVAGITAIANLTNSVVNFGKKMVSNLTKPLTQGIMQGGLLRARNIEQATFSFEGQKIGKSKGNESLSYYKEVMDAVLGTSYSYDVAARAASQLAASNVGVEKTMKRLADGTKVESKVLNTDMTKALLGIAGVASMTGKDFDTIAQIFTRVAGQGRVMAMDLNSIASHGLNAAAVLGSSLGKTEAEIRELVSKGEISFEQFSKAMSDAFGAHAKDSTLMFQGALDDVNAALARIGADFYGPALNAGRDILNSITPLVDAVHNKLNPALSTSNNIMEVGSKKLSQYLDMLSYMIEIFPKMDQSGMNDWINEHMNAWTNIADLYKHGDVLKAIKGLKDYTASIKGMDGSGVSGYRMLGDYFNVATNKDLLSKYISDGDKVNKIVEKATIGTEDLKTVITGMVKDGTIGFNEMNKAFHKYWSESDKAMSIVHEDGTTLRDDFAKYLQEIIAAEGPSAKFNANLATFANIMNGISTVVQSFKTILGGVASIFLTLAQHLAPLGTIFVELVKQVAQFVVWLSDAIATSKRFTSIIDSIVSAIDKFFTVLQLNKLGSTLGPKVLSGITKAFEFLAMVVDRVAAGATLVFKTVATYFNKVIDKIYEVLHTADIMKEFLSTMGKAGFIVALVNIGYALTKPAEALDTFVKSITNVGKASKTAATAIGDIFSSIAGLFGKIGKVIDEVRMALYRMQQLLVATTILEIGLAIAVVAGALYLLSKINARSIDELVPTLISFFSVAGTIGAGVVYLSKLKSSVKVWNRAVNDIKAIGLAMLEFAVSIAIMAAAITRLSKIDKKSLYRATGVVETLLITMGLLAKFLSGTVTKETGLKALWSGKTTSNSMTKGMFGLLAMAEAINILGTALVKVASITDPALMYQSLGVIEAMLWSLFAIVKLLSDDKAAKMAKGATTLLAMAFAVRLLTKPVIELSAIANPENASAMWHAVGAIGALMGALSLMMVLMSGVKGSFKNAVGIIIIAAAIKMLSNVAIELSKLSGGELIKGIGSIVGALFMLMVTLNTLDSDGMLKKAIGIVLVAYALKELQDIILTFGDNIDTVGAGLAGLFGALLLLFGAVYLFKKAPIAGIAKLFVTLLLGAVIVAAFGAAIAVFGIGVSIFSAGLSALAGACKELTPVMGTFLGVVIGFGVAIAILATVGLPAIGVLMALAAAFMMFGAGLALMGVGMEKLATSVQLLAELKGQLAGTAKSITDFVTDINKLKSEANAIGESFKSIADPLKSIRKSADELDAKFKDLVKTYSELQTKTTDAIGTLSTSLTNISKLNKDSFGQATTAIKAFIDEMKNIKADAITASESASQISTGILDMKKSIDEVVGSLDGFKNRHMMAFDSLGASINKVAEPLKTLNNLKSSLGTLSDNLGSFIDSMVGMKDKAAEISQSASDISTSLKQVGDAAGSAANNFTQFTQGTADIMTQMGAGMESIAKGIQSLGKSYSTLPAAASAISDFYKTLSQLNGVASSITSNTKSVSSAVKQLGNAAKKSITKDTMSSSGETLVAGFVSGINKKKKDVSTAVDNVSKNAEKKVNNRRNEWVKIGKHLIGGLISGINSQMRELEKAVIKLEQYAERAVKAEAKIKSPSRVWMQIGSYMGQGLAIGIKNSGDKVASAAVGLASVSEDAVSSAISAISTAIESDWNTDPTIKPVVDLSDIKKNADYINSTFGGGSFGVNGSRMAGSIAGIQNGRGMSSIDRLAKKIDGMTETMNSRSMNNYITVDGASNPEDFADELISNFRLNARTV